jgi:cephalosporin hydroxylase
VSSRIESTIIRTKDTFAQAITFQADRWALRRLNALVGRGTNESDVALRSITDAFMSLYRPQVEGDVPHQIVRSAIIDQFHRLYYHDSDRTWKATSYRGITVQKCPLDLWVYHEIISELRPDLIIETGSAYGGSAYFMADLCDTLEHGCVVSVDIESRINRPNHDRITYVTGSSIAPDVLEKVSSVVSTYNTVLVILDSDHTREHVILELEAYAPMVTPGSYLIVEDSNVSGHPALPSFPPGPMEAIDQFLPRHPEFTVDREREKFMMTFSPSGYLYRSSDADRFPRTRG